MARGGGTVTQVRPQYTNDPFAEFFSQTFPGSIQNALATFAQLERLRLQNEDAARAQQRQDIAVGQLDAQQNASLERVRGLLQPQVGQPTSIDRVGQDDPVAIAALSDPGLRSTLKSSMGALGDARRSSGRATQAAFGGIQAVDQQIFGEGGIAERVASKAAADRRYASALSLASSLSNPIEQQRVRMGAAAYAYGGSPQVQERGLSAILDVVPAYGEQVRTINDELEAEDRKRGLEGDTQFTAPTLRLFGIDPSVLPEGFVLHRAREIFFRERGEMRDDDRFAAQRSSEFQSTRDVRLAELITGIAEGIIRADGGAGNVTWPQALQTARNAVGATNALSPDLEERIRLAPENTRAVVDQALPELEGITDPREYAETVNAIRGAAIASGVDPITASSAAHELARRGPEGTLDHYFDSSFSMGPSTEFPASARPDAPAAPINTSQTPRDQLTELPANQANVPANRRGNQGALRASLARKEAAYERAQNARPATAAGRRKHEQEQAQRLREINEIRARLGEEPRVSVVNDGRGFL